MRMRMQAPNKKRHFRSRLVSPTSRLNARYDISRLLAARAKTGRSACHTDQHDGLAATHAGLAITAVNAKLVLEIAAKTGAADVVPDRRSAFLDGARQYLRDRHGQPADLA